MEIKNNSRTTYDFVKAGGEVRDGVPETVSILPGATATLDVAESDLERLQTIMAYSDGALVASGEEVKRASAAPARPAEGTKPKPPQVI